MQRSLRKADLSTGTPRSGFSLIELMIVIVVIAILAGMLLPALRSVQTSARNAQVASDIKNLEAGIAAFKLKFGMEPPSSFLISDDPSFYTGTTAPQVGKNSLSIMRQLWPSFDPLGPNNPAGRLGISGVKYLNGAECLVFFLGGPGTYAVSSKPEDSRPNGFSANPADPFNLTGSSRVGPFIEFDLARLVDVGTPDGFFELLDPLPNQTMPYQYLSSYDGRGYQPGGYDSDLSTVNDNEIIEGMSNVYLKRDENWATAGSLPSVNQPGDFWNGRSFQIISPGLDGSYGVGGWYSSEKGIAVKDGATPYRARENRAAEADNITNFSGGPLGKFYTPQ
ncbi:type II secretion system protein [Planctomicrobium sp. SH661]|uniref:type II secretion system protein n=1 Tax=Planctomicrobium sp. SH661 TaxID=3448124 RepID=UPI003F5BB3AC